ncbi:MAG TPA: hypothetical protein VFA95_03245 [Gammaproteobacteria bacterium]|nr:hypothetical protein [Gammaproteobacteria bacterium]
MTLPGVAIAVHLLGILWWIGGLAFVTLVFLPMLRHQPEGDRLALLQTIEGRFAPQARTAVLLVGLSGGYMLWALGAWRWLGQPGFWWLDAMIGYWLLFAVMLFIIEPLGLLQRMVFSARDPAAAWRRFHWLHGVLLALAVIVIAGAAAGAHGF